MDDRDVDLGASIGVGRDDPVKFVEEPALRDESIRNVRPSLLSPDSANRLVAYGRFLKRPSQRSHTSGTAVDAYDETPVAGPWRSRGDQDYGAASVTGQRRRRHPDQRVVEDTMRMVPPQQ